MKITPTVRNNRKILRPVKEEKSESKIDKQTSEPQRKCQIVQKAMPHQQNGGSRRMMTCYVCGNRKDPYNNGGFTEECTFNPNSNADNVAAAPTTSHGDKVYAGNGHTPYLNYQYPRGKSSHRDNNDGYARNDDGYAKQDKQDGGYNRDDGYGKNDGYAGGYEDTGDDKGQQTEKSSCKITYKGKMKCKVCGGGKGGAYSEQCDYEANDPGHHGQKSYDYSSAGEKNYQSPKNGNGGNGGSSYGGGNGGGGGGYGGGNDGGGYGGGSGGDGYGGGSGGGGYGGGNGGSGGGGYGGSDNYGGGNRGYGGGGYGNDGYGGYPDYGGYGSGSGHNGYYESLCKNPFLSYAYGCSGSGGYAAADDQGGYGGGADHGKSSSPKKGGGDQYKGSSSHHYAPEEDTAASSSSKGSKGDDSKKNCKIVFKDYNAYSPYGGDNNKDKKDKEQKPKMKCTVCVRSDGYGGVTEECNYTGGGELTAAFPGGSDLAAFFQSPRDQYDKYYSGDFDDQYKDSYY
ncbi:hypothetical protein CHUAL_005294 [Chamberlinius hualienensis]